MSSFTISIEPAEGGKALYAPLAPATAGAPAKGQLALKLLITNTGAATLHVTGVTLSFSGGPAMSPASFAVNLTVAPGSTAAWMMEPPYVLLPQPAPASVVVAVSAQGVATAVTATWPLAAHANPVPGGGYLFPARTNDLRPDEYWTAASAQHEAAGDGSQMFGYDMAVLGWDVAHWTHLLPGTSGAQNEHFRIWGKPIYAMAAGVVVAFRNDIPTNPAPGTVFPPPPPYEGNHFYLQHGDELVLYAHFQGASMNPALLTNGTSVKAGQFLGLAGNSGNSSGPHLHIHAIKGTAPWSGPPRPLLLRDTHVVDPAALSPPSADGPWTKMAGEGMPPVPSFVWPAARKPSTAPPLPQVATACNAQGELHVLAIDENNTLWHTIRAANGTWTSPLVDVQAVVPGAGPGPIARVAAACSPQGDLHVLAIDENDGLWHTIRTANGAWPYGLGDVQAVVPDVGPGPTPLVAAACNAQGDLHIVAIDRNDGLWHTIRTANGAWPYRFGDVQAVVPDVGPGPTPRVAAACNAQGDLHIVAIDRNDGLWHTIRTANGAWPYRFGDVQAVVPGTGPGPTPQVAAACNAQGDLHILAVDRNDGLWHTIRTTNGAWPYRLGDVQAVVPGSGPGPTPRVAAACNAQGDLHILAIDRNDGLWHTIRTANGAWPYPLGDVQAVVPE